MSFQMHQKHDPINLLFACDDGMFAGLVLAASSALMHLDAPVVAHIHLFDAGITDVHFAFLVELLSRISPRAQVTRYAVDLRSFKGLKPLNGGWTAYARLLAPDLIAEDRILYLDCDLYVGRNLVPLYEQSMLAPIAGVVDVLIPSGVHAFEPEQKLFKALGVASPGVYVNTGVLLLDLCRLRELKFTSWCVQTGESYAQQLSMYDQTLINAFVSIHGLQPLSGVWNMPQYCWDLPTCPVGHEVLLHFMGYQNGKPWTISRKSSSYQLVRAFYQHIGFDLDSRKMADNYENFQKSGSPVGLLYLIGKYSVQCLLKLVGAKNTWPALQGAIKKYVLVRQDHHARKQEVDAAIASWRCLREKK